MALNFKSGASSTLLSIDPNSGAARATLYTVSGSTALESNPSGPTYMLPIDFRHTAADAAGTTVWAMRNGSSRTVYLRNIFFNLAFDGTGSVATPRYSVQRFASATPTGGSALTIVEKDNSAGASTVTDARSGVLTTTGVTFETDAMVFGLPIPKTGLSMSSQVYLETQNQTQFCNFELAPNEGLAIRLNSATAAVVGLVLTGFVEWQERG